MTAETPPAGAAPAAGQGDRGHSRISSWQQFARFLPDLARLLVDIVRDPRVSLASKVVAGATVVYVVSPIDVVPDIVPVLGKLDDIAVVALAMRRLFESAGVEVLRDLWKGTDEGFIALMVLGGMER